MMRSLSLLKQTGPTHWIMMVLRDGGRDQPMVAFAVGFLLRLPRHPDLATHLVPAGNRNWPYPRQPSPSRRARPRASSVSRMRGKLFFHAPRLLKWASMLATVIAPGWLESTCATARTWSGRALGQFCVICSFAPFLAGFCSISSAISDCSPIDTGVSSS
jgi:hypothetical protein